MRRTSRIALITLVAATVLGGCSGGGEQTATEVPPELQPVAEAGAVVTDFCTAAATNVEAGTKLTEFSTGAPAPRPEDEIAAVVEPVRESNEQLIASAPEMMKADLTQVAEVTELKLAAFQASMGDPAAVNADPVITEKSTAAAEPSARVRQYLRSVCRIDPS